MDFQARVLQFIGETTGTSKMGKPWKKKEWLVETFGQYPRKVKLQSFNERADQLNLENGKDYTFYVDLESREFNGRWYTDVSVYRADETTGQPQPNFSQNQQMGGFQAQGPQGGYNNAPYGNQTGSFGGGSFSAAAVEESDEDLPF